MRHLLWCLCGLLFFSSPAAAQSISVRMEGNQLRIAAPAFHFVAGDALRRLRNGASVNYLFRVTLTPTKGGSTLLQVAYRFVISYDLWEEKFAVTRLEPSPRSISHLSAAAAESWCLDSIVIPTDTLPADQIFWASLEYELEKSPPVTDPAESDSTMSRLINIFSRNNPRQELRVRIEGGPFRLSSLRLSR